jgi:uncharacterized integral membrane protein (TIGR00698 family)
MLLGRMKARWTTAQGRCRNGFPGLMASCTVAAAATFLSDHYGAPVMLFALLLGMAMNFLSEPSGPCLPGIELAAKHLLRLGVALLGLRITWGQIAHLGWFPVVLVMVSVVATIAFGLLAARMAGFKPAFGMLTGGAVAICGASAALAISTVLPQHPLRERATLFTVIGVSALSTVVMVLYPMLTRALGLDDGASGMFLGATIHDVAQVVGAGYGISSEAGDVATVVKLMRVMMLIPVIVVVAMVNRRSRAADEPQAVLLPWFVTAFMVFIVIGSLGWVPASVQTAGTEFSRWLLVIAMSAIGLKTKLQEVVTVGLKPVVVMVAETVFLAVLALALLLLLR